MILTPNKKIIHPRNASVTLNDLMRRRELHAKNIALDVLADVTVREKGRLVGHEQFRCHSFVSNWMKIMRLMMADCRGDVVNSLDGATYNCGEREDAILNITQTASVRLGPVIGTGTTTETANDTNLEQQITEGSAAPTASALTGTTHSSSSTKFNIYDDGGNSISSDQYNQYFIELTSGAFSGQERIIRDTVEASPDRFYLYEEGWGYGGFANDTDVDNVTYKIKSYGMMTHGTVGFTAPEDDGDKTSTMTITRTFANGCGSTLDVTEFGLLLKVPYYSSYDIRPLVIRDVKVTPVSIANGQELTLTYTFACEA
ncbi:MAG: hypothetical protein ACYSUP_11735 [Planctomycetota bacterium]|jgi:hypothetical protein